MLDAVSQLASQLLDTYDGEVISITSLLCHLIETAPHRDVTVEDIFRRAAPMMAKISPGTLLTPPLTDCRMIQARLKADPLYIASPMSTLEVLRWTLNPALPSLSPENVDRVKTAVMDSLENLV